MAVSAENLSVEVVLDSRGAVKGFKSLTGEVTTLEKAINDADKELREAERVVKSAGETAEESAKGFESLADAETRAGESAAALGKAQSQSTSGFVAAAQSIQTLGTAISALTDSYSMLTNNEAISRLSRLLKISALLADIKGYDAMADRLRNASDKVIEFGVANEKAGRSVDEALTKYAAYDDQIESVKEGAISLAQSMAAIAAIPFVPAIAAQTVATYNLGKAFIQARGSMAGVSEETTVFVSKLGNFRSAAQESGKAVVDLFKGSKAFAGIFAKDFVTATEEIRKVGDVAKNIGRVGVLSLAEASLTAGGALGAMGAVLTSFDSTGAKVTGTLLVIAAALTGAFGVAINLALGAIGRLIEGIGDTLMNAMTAFEAKAIKLQSTMAQFTFVVKGFNKVYGSDAVGSLEKWQGALEDTVATTIFTREETAKAIKLLVAEGKTLGLTTQQTTKLLEKSKDIASATGNALDDVIGRVIAGLAGNSQAVLTLGINTSEAALNQLELVKATGKTVDALSEQDKILARLEEVFVATKPLAGAAAAAVMTVAGAYAMLDKRLSEVQAKLGEAGAFTTLYLTAFAKIAEAFLALPPSVIDAVGALQDFAGVTLKIAGMLIQSILTITALTTAYALLTGAIAKFAVVQAALTGVFSLLGSTVGATTIAVTSLTGVFTNLAIILRAGFTVAIAGAGAALWAFFKTLATGAVLAAPFILVIAKFTAIAFGLVEGFRQVEKETKLFGDAVKIVSNVFGSFTGTADKAKSQVNSFADGVKQFTQLLVGLGTIAVTSFVSVINQLTLALFKVGAVLGIFSASLGETMAGAAEKAQENIEKLTLTTAKALAVVASLGASTALASGTLEEQAKEADALALSLAKTASVTSKLIELNRELEIAKVQGNEALGLGIEKQILALKFQAEVAADKRIEIADGVVRNNAQIAQTFADAVKAATKQADEARKKILEGAKDGGAVKELIALRQKLEGEQIRDQIVKLKFLGDESGAKEAIQRLQGALAELNGSIEKEELEKVAMAFQVEKIEASSKAIQGLTSIVDSLGKSLVSVAKEFAALTKFKSDPLQADLEAVYEAIQLEKDKAISMGANVRFAEEQATAAVATATALYGQSDALKNIKAISDDIAKNQKAADDVLASVRTQIISQNEDLLRIGMTKEQLAERELQFELDKLEVLRNQVRTAGQLGAEENRQFDLAKKTLEAKAKATGIQAKVPTPGSAEAAPIIGAAVPAVAAVGAGPVGAFMAAAEMIVGVVQKLIDFLPNIINAVAKLFSSLADLPNMLLKAVQNLVGSIVKFTANFIPSLFQAIPAIIDEILTAAFETIPAAAQQVIEMLPALFEGLLKKIPLLVSKLVDGLVSSSQSIGLGIIGAIVQNLPAFFKAIVLFIPRLWIAIAKGIIDGILKGIKNIKKAFGKVFNGKAIGDAFKDGAAAIKKATTGLSSQLFSVGDLTNSTKAEDKAKDLIEAAEKAGRSIWEALRDAILKAWAWIKSIGRAIWEGFKEDATVAWEFIKSIGIAIWDSFKESAVTSWEWIKTIGIAIWESFKSSASAAWQFVKSIGIAVWESFSTTATAGWEFVKSIGSAIWSGVVGAVSGAWDFIKSIGSTLWSGVVNSVGTIWESLKTAGKKIWEGLGELFSGDGSAAMQKFKEAGGAIWRGLVGLFEGGIALFQKLGTNIWDGLKNAWNGGIAFLSNLGSKIWNGFKDLWNAGLDALGNLGSKIWNAFKALWEAGGDILAKLGSKIWGAFKAAWDASIATLSAFGGKIWDAFKGAWDAGISKLKNLGSSIWDGFVTAYKLAGSFFSSLGSDIWKGLKSGFTSVTDGFGKILSALDPSNILKKMFNIDWGGPKGPVEKFIGMDFPWVAFADGGMVPGKAAVMGDSSRNDTVPALLSPGEAVIPRTLMQDPAVSKLINGILGGKGVGMHAEGWTLKRAGAAVLTGGASEAAPAVQAVAEKAADVVIPDWVKKLFDSLKKFVGHINIMDMVKDPRKYIESAIRGAAGTLIRDPFMAAKKGIGMATGGVVPGVGMKDTTPAMLTPGEFVMRRSASESIGTNALAAMNATGRTPQGETTFNISVTLNANERLDESFIKSRLLPTLKDELRKESLRGGFVIAAGGIRS